MKAVVSTTYDDKYLFFLPIITWCWNKLGVDVFCFSPDFRVMEMPKLELINRAMQTMRCDVYYFKSPEHKEATYAQCSRLYAAALDTPKDEVIITGDIDMAVFREPDFKHMPLVWGSDLTPEGQYPMCYCIAPAGHWRKFMGIKGKTVQECLDKLLGDIECENFRGNYWGKDQETVYNALKNDHIDFGNGFSHFVSPRARPGTQFAMNRVDRDDINWRSYMGPDLIDAHLWRPGYEDGNFHNILELLQTQYPEDNFQWLVDYRNEYIKIL